MKKIWIETGKKIVFQGQEHIVDLTFEIKENGEIIPRYYVEETENEFNYFDASAAKPCIEKSFRVEGWVIDEWQRCHRLY